MNARFPRIAIASLLLAGFTLAQAQSLKPADQIETRQAGYTFMAWNMGKIKANLDGEYNKDQVLAAANVIAAIAESGMGALFGPGTDKAVGNRRTHVKPELFQKMPEVAKLNGDLVTASGNLLKAAESGDVAAVKTAFGETGKACKACHEQFREKM